MVRRDLADDLRGGPVRDDPAVAAMLDGQAGGAQRRGELAIILVLALVMTVFVSRWLRSMLTRRDRPA